MKNKVIIFDFDGVIVDSMPLSYSINKQIMPDLEIEEWQKWFEGNLYREIRKEHSNDVSQSVFFKQYDKRVIDILPIDGMSEIIAKLAKEYILVIISSSTQKAIKAYLQKYNLSKYFKEILGKETHTSKVEKFNIILDKYKIEADETLIITDTVGDIKEANEVGIKSLGVIWGLHNGTKLKEAEPQFVAKKPRDIIAGVNLILNR